MIFCKLSVQSIHIKSSNHHPDAYHHHMIILIIIIAETEASSRCSSNSTYIYIHGKDPPTMLGMAPAMCPITSSSKNLLSKEHQASLWSTQTSPWLVVWSTHLLCARPSQHTGASLLVSTPYLWYSDIWSRCALTCRGTLGSQTTSHNSSSHR